MQYIQFFFSRHWKTLVLFFKRVVEGCGEQHNILRKLVSATE